VPTWSPVLGFAICNNADRAATTVRPYTDNRRNCKTLSASLGRWGRALNLKPPFFRVAVDAGRVWGSVGGVIGAGGCRVCGRGVVRPRRRDWFAVCRGLGAGACVRGAGGSARLVIGAGRGGPAGVR
jgi:hypothetical protein